MDQEPQKQEQMPEQKPNAQPDGSSEQIPEEKSGTESEQKPEPVQEPKPEQNPGKSSPYNFAYFDEMNKKAAEKKKRQAEKQKQQKRVPAASGTTSSGKKKKAGGKAPAGKPNGTPQNAPQQRPVQTSPPNGQINRENDARREETASGPEMTAEKRKSFPKDPLPKKSKKQYKTPDERKKYVRRARILLGMGGAFVLLLILSILCMTVLFRIDDVEVIGASRYPSQEIAEASGVKNGQNLFTLNEGEVAERIMTEKPYVKSVSITRHLPSKIVIEVTDMTVVGAVQRDNKYVVIGTNGKMLEEVDKLPAKCPLLTGAKLTKVEEGKEIEFEEEQQKMALDAFAEALENGDIEKLTKLDISDTYNIKATYDGRIQMEFGSPTDMNYKFRFATAVLASGKIKAGQKGTMDLSQVSDLNRVFFAPDFSVTTKADQEAAKKLSDLTGLQNDTAAAASAGDVDYGALIGLPGTLGYGTSSKSTSSDEDTEDEDTDEDTDEENEDTDEEEYDEEEEYEDEETDEDDTDYEEEEE